MIFSNIRIEDVKLEIGGLVKKMRTNKKMSQEELAKQLNLSRITIQNIERGKNFTIDTLLIVFQYLDELESFRDYIKSRMDGNNDIKSFY